MKSRTPYTKTSQSYTTTLRQAQSHMHPVGRLFSRIIHLRIIELISDGLATTLFRPIPLLTGSLAAIIIPAGIWVLAKYYGYSLAGSETVICFILGWLVGYIIDYAKLLTTGRHQL